ncbi:MAG: hypothetical protein ACFFAS_07025 [Promethearchaeota archaeon]
MKLYCSHCGMKIEEKGNKTRYYCISCQKYRDFFTVTPDETHSQVSIQS